MHRNIKEEEKEKAFKTCLINEIFKNKNINQDFILEENGSNISSGERQKNITC